MRLYLGTSGFGYAEWKGSFYPKGMSHDEMLTFYANRFNSVEVNNSFYRMPDATMLAGWASRTPKSFRFAFKAPRRITHEKMIFDTESELKYFLKNISILEDRLGPVNFQFPPFFKVNLERLKGFLRVLPKDFQYAFEFRNASWFSEEVYGALRSSGAAVCLNDDVKGALTRMIDTTDFGFLKLRKETYTPADLQAWSREVKRHKWRTAYVFFKHEETASGPEMAADFAKIWDSEER